MTKARLADVARLAGVSKGTASKALNQREDVAAQTRARVAEAAQELGYTTAPRVGPGTMSPRAAPAVPTIWVTFDSLANHYAGTILDALVSEAAALGALAVVSTWRGTHSSDRDSSEASPIAPSASPTTPSLPRQSRWPTGEPPSDAWLTRAHSLGVQAFILITTPVGPVEVETCRRLDTPLVIIDPATPTPTGAMSIGASNWRGGVQATDYLLQLGHRRIAMVGAPPGSTPGSERVAGYRSALARAGITIAPELIVPGTFGEQDATSAVPILTGPDRATAVFAASDAVALGVIDVARRLGLDVPRDLSIVGFDDSYAAPAASPPLTTVRQPLAQMGAMALRIAVDRIRDPRAVIPPVELATDLIVRSSTAPPPLLEGASTP